MGNNTTTLTSAQKTNASCYNMFTKWQEKTQPEANKKKVGNYILDCINGYPNKTKMNPALLMARIRGIEKHAADNKITLKKEEITEAQNLVTKYRDSKKAKKAKPETEATAATPKVTTDKVTQAVKPKVVAPTK